MTKRGKHYLPRGWALYLSLALAVVKLSGIIEFSWLFAALPVGGALLVYLLGSAIYAITTALESATR